MANELLIENMAGFFTNLAIHSEQSERLACFLGPLGTGTGLKVVKIVEVAAIYVLAKFRRKSQERKVRWRLARESALGGHVARCR